jgi:type 1 fimbriae regulatory protein FimB
MNKMNNEKRTREFLTPDEVNKLLAAAKKNGRNPERDFALLFLMARHGLRVSEACQLKMSDLDLEQKTIYVHRLKRGKSGVHPLYNGELKALSDWFKIRRTMASSFDNIFLSEQRKPLNRGTVFLIIRKVAAAAGLEDLQVHPHSLRHSAGYSLANRGADTRLIQDFLGHQNIQHTCRYTQLAPNRFANLY